MSLKNKILSGIGIFVEVLLFAGVYVFHYFTKMKLGMRRWVNFNSMVIEDKVGTILPVVILVLLIIASIVAIALSLRSFLKAKSPWGLLSILTSLAAFGYFSYVVFCLDKRIMPEKDFTVILLGLVLILQDIRMIMVNRTKGKTDGKA